jgi:hypothetical protein
VRRPRELKRWWPRALFELVCLETKCGLLTRDDDYPSAGKPVCDYEDRLAREQLIDALAKDADALLGTLDGRELGPELEQAAALLAAVVGQGPNRSGGTSR